MSLLAAVALLYLASLAVFLVGNSILLSVAKGGHSAPNLTMDDLGHAAGKLSSAVISQARAALHEAGANRRFRFEVTTYARSSSRLLAARVIVEDTEDDSGRQHLAQGPTDIDVSEPRSVKGLGVLV